MKKIVLAIGFFSSLCAFAQTITTIGNGNWDATTTWDLGVIPTVTNDVVLEHAVVIPNGYTAAAKSLVLSGQGSRRLTISTGSNLTVENDITLNRFQDGFFIYGLGSNGNLGTLIYKGTITDNRKVLIKKRFPVTFDNKWNLLSIPFYEAKIGDLTSNSAIEVNASNKFSFASFNNANAVSTKYEYVDSPLSGTPLFGIGQGYSVKLDGAGTNVAQVEINIRGKLNEGDVTYPISGSGNGFNLVGNPYVAYQFANTSANATNNILSVNGSTGADLLDEDTLWFWDTINESWVTVNQSSDAYHINPLQGYFVKSKAAGGVFTSKKSMETHNAGSSTFLKSATNRFQIDLTIAQAGKTRKTSVRYLDNATTSFDNGFDSSIFGGYKSTFEIYTNTVESNNVKKLAIQSLPIKNFEDIVIPVGINAAPTNEITFSANALNLPLGYKVYLEDRLKNVFTRLDEANSEYKIATTEAVSVGRFFLHARTSSVLSVDSALLNSVAVFKLNNSSLKITGLKEGKTLVSLYNLLGKEVMSTTFKASSSQTLSIPKLAAGVYIVQVKTEAGTLNKKIILE